MDADCIFSSDVSFLSLQPRQSNVHQGFTGVPAAANQTPGIPTAECHSICLRWAPLPQLFPPAKGQSLSTEELPLAPETFVLPLGVPQLWVTLFSAWKCVQAPEADCLLGKEGWQGSETFRAPSHFCHSSFWSLNSFLLPLNLVSVLKRAADSSHQSCNEISKFETLLLG